MVDELITMKTNRVGVGDGVVGSESWVMRNGTTLNCCLRVHLLDVTSFVRVLVMLLIKLLNNY